MLRDSFYLDKLRLVWGVKLQNLQRFTIYLYINTIQTVFFCWFCNACKQLSSTTHKTTSRSGFIFLLIITVNQHISYYSCPT